MKFENFKDIRVKPAQVAILLLGLGLGTIEININMFHYYKGAK